MWLVELLASARRIGQGRLNSMPLSGCLKVNTLRSATVEMRSTRITFVTQS